MLIPYQRPPGGGRQADAHSAPSGDRHQDSHWRVRRRLERVASVLDSAVRLPVLGWRVGLDAPLNLIPGAGLLTSTVVSGWLVWEARRIGAPRPLALRMAGNVVLDAAISAIPVVGWLGDLFFRANDRNVALLRRHLDAQHPFRQPHDRWGGGIIDGQARRLS